jgi:alkylation response protein AidB-like acyl-CoA dehydrogenase
MDFEHTGPEKEFSASVARFAEEHLAGGAAARARAGEMSWEAAGILADQGLMGITIPTNKGGRGGTLMQAVIAIQQLAMVCPKSADIVQAGNFGAIRTFAEYATEEQRQRLLPDLLAGRKLMSLGMSEPEAGSAATELVTSATEDGDDFILNGSKVYGTHSVDAEVFLIYVRYGPGVGGIGSVLVERGAPGFTWGPPKAFMSGEKWCELHFENCRIPASNVLLGPGGFKKQIAGFNVERIGNSARSIALGRYTFNQARDYAKRRVQFGKSLSQFQGLQWKFADMAGEAGGRGAFAFPRGGQCRQGLSVRLRDLRRQGSL